MLSVLSSAALTPKALPVVPHKKTESLPIHFGKSLPQAVLETNTAPLHIEQFHSLFANNPGFIARIFATNYKPRQVGGYTIHNEFFHPLKTSQVTSQKLQDLFANLDKKGSFQLNTNPKTGLIRTSDKADDMHHMSRQWTTDSCMMFPIQREQDPEAWKRNMITNAAAVNHKEALKAIENTVKNPDWYRKGSVMDGIPHIFWPFSVVHDEHGIPDPTKIKLDDTWFNNKRLESQALLLQRLVETLHGGLIPNAQGKVSPWGFQQQDLSGSQAKAGGIVTTAIHNMARFLIAANTDAKSKRFNFHTPTASSWEEEPFKEGMTSDAAITVQALEHLRKFLYTSQTHEDPFLQTVRQQIIKNSPALTKEKLDRFIEAGRRFVESRVTEPLRNNLDPVQTPRRPYDTSLSILAASNYRFEPGNELEDAKLRLQLIQKNKAALLKTNGMLRYGEYVGNKEGRLCTLHDSYLNADSPHWPKTLLHPSSFGKSQSEVTPKDVGSLDEYLERQKYTHYNYSAQWQLGLSASLQGLAKAKMDVLKDIQKQGHASSEHKKLLNEINQEQTDFINRNIAAIPGPLPGSTPIIRADGTKVRPYTPMEAYQVVPDLNGEMKFIPGEHALPWHTSQLYDGLKKAIVAQKLEEQMKQQKLL